MFLKRFNKEETIVKEFPPYLFVSLIIYETFYIFAENEFNNLCRRR